MALNLADFVVVLMRIFALDDLHPDQTLVIKRDLTSLLFHCLKHSPFSLHIPQSYRFSYTANMDFFYTVNMEPG